MRNKKKFPIVPVVIAGTYIVLDVIAHYQKKSTVYAYQPNQQNPMEGKSVEFVQNSDESENADGECGHLEATGESRAFARRQSVYEHYIKRAADKALSFGGLALLSPLMGGIALAIKIEDPGPALFTQKRVGQDKQYFKLHKFRSMRMDTPHDVPTHMLENPESYITRVGGFLRKHSLDELPQIWDIFVGNMSVIGPRPALWNQDVLVAERDKVGANDVKPGLTGWAQINGRDELEIPEKARLDGVYTEALEESSLCGLKMDAKCFIGSLHVFGNDDTVIEGGTGSMAAFSKGALRPGVPEQDPEEYFACDYHFTVDRNSHKNVLIVGAGSYIGESFVAYAKQYYSDNFTFTVVDTMPREDGRSELDALTPEQLSSFDIVYHLAGIAHADVGNVSEKVKEKYYKVNTDLAVATARRYKEVLNAAGRKGLFVFMSSMIVYGDSAPYGKKFVITKDTQPSPANFYGDSKWQADKGIRSLADSSMHIAIIRPPMIYGKDSKGNYPTLAKLAKKLPVFPDAKNERSMLYIGNLCEFLSKMFLSTVYTGENNEDVNSLIFMPQNSTYTKTSDMVKKIAEMGGHRIHIQKVLNPAVVLADHVPGKICGLVDKAFGNNAYDERLSKYDGLDYQKYSLDDSIRLTESEGQSKKPAVLFLVNHDVVIYNFRLEIVERLLHDGYEVHISSPYGERIDDLVALGAHWHDITIDRHGMNPKEELSILSEYRHLIKSIKPAVILGFTIKPNIYGAIAAREAHIPFVANITGLGTAVENGGWKQKIIIALYKFAFTDVQTVFFQNTENRQFFIDNKIALTKYKLLPGSGVNVDRFPLQAYPDAGDGLTGKPVRFAFISRIMKEKGIDQYLEVAKEIKKKYPLTEFHVCGFAEKEYEGHLKELNDNGTIIYHGMIRDVSGFLKDINCVIHPTYYPEGMSNVLLEACSSGRPIITTDRSGCREIVDDGVNGYMIPEKNTERLVKAIEKFLALSNDGRRQMGLNGRRKVEEKFNRNVIVDAYMAEVEKAEK